MLLEALMEYLHAEGICFLHSEEDFIPISFRAGDKTERGIEIKGQLRRRLKAKGKGYDIVGYAKVE